MGGRGPPGAHLLLSFLTQEVSEEYYDPDQSFARFFASALKRGGLYKSDPAHSWALFRRRKSCVEARFPQFSCVKQKTKRTGLGLRFA